MTVSTMTPARGRRKRHPLWPVPEILPGEAGQGWRLQACPSGTGAVNPEEKFMMVPVGASPHDIEVRIHEMAHAVFSKGDPFRNAKLCGVDETIYQSVEDCRIQDLTANEVGIPMPAGHLPAAILSELTSEAVTLLRYRDCCLSLVASGHTGADRPIRGVLARVAQGGDQHAQRILDLADQARQRLREANIWRQSSTEAVARWLQEQLKHLEDELPKDQDKAAGDDENNGGRTEERRPRRPAGRPRGPWTSTSTEIDDCDEEFDTEAFGTPRPGTGTAKPGRRRKPGLLVSVLDRSQRTSAGRFVPWGTMSTQRVPLSGRIPGALGRRWRPAIAGLDLRFPERLLLDGRGFAKRTYIAGGTVLVDCSGSMNLSAHDINRIVDAAPGATVAIYAGLGARGTLRILASRGRVAAEQYCTPDLGGMNVVDGPALVWLSAQSTPRFWVSDGRVTGVNDVPGPINHREARRLCDQGDIERVESVGQAIVRLNALNRKARPLQTSRAKRK